MQSNARLQICWKVWRPHETTASGSQQKVRKTSFPVLKQPMNSEKEFFVVKIFDLRYYGCGLVAPDELIGCDVIDLGCGAGVDCFIVSKLVGENGHVTGVDMTSEQVRNDFDIDRFDLNLVAQPASSWNLRENISSIMLSCGNIKNRTRLLFKVKSKT